MAVVVMCLCGDEVLGVVTRCPRKATSFLLNKMEPLRRLPVCTEHREAMQAVLPELIELPLPAALAP